MFTTNPLPPSLDDEDVRRLNQPRTTARPPLRSCLPRYHVPSVATFSNARDPRPARDHQEPSPAPFHPSFSIGDSSQIEGSRYKTRISRSRSTDTGISFPSCSAPCNRWPNEVHTKTTPVSFSFRHQRIDHPPRQPSAHVARYDPADPSSTSPHTFATPPIASPRHVYSISSAVSVASNH